MTKKFLTLLLLLCSLASYAGKKEGISAIEKAIKKAPGNTELRCQLIELLLEKGDTLRAEEQLRYAQKMQATGCISLHAAHIAYNKHKYAEAAIAFSEATLLGSFCQEDSLIYLTDSLTRGSITARMKAAVVKDKSSPAPFIALAHLALHKTDTLSAISMLENAALRGDTASRSLAKQLKNSLPVDSTESKVLMRIPFSRNMGKIELSLQVNGLTMKATVDTTATQPTISGVTSQFMLKNDYASYSEVVETNILIARTIDFPGNITLRNVRLHNRNNQTEPIILSLSVFSSLGRARINESEAVIEILDK